MRQNGLKEIRTRKNIATLNGVACPACLGTGINPRTRLRCLICHGTRSVRLYRLSL